MSSREGKVRFEGIAYGQLRVFVTTPHGRTSVRSCHGQVSADDLLRMADAIRGCQQVYENPRTGARPKTLDEVRGNPAFVPVWIGHAFWHLQHPDRSMPCRPDGEHVIDVVERLALPEPTT